MLKKLKQIPAQIWVWFLCAIVTAVIAVSLFVPFVAFTCVSGSSMNPTLEDGDRYLATGFIRPQAGDVVIADSRYLDQPIIKRVIGVPGDTIAIMDGTVYRNQLPLQEDYIAEPMVTADMQAFTLGEDKYFLMGDNRNNSLDSRRIGPVSADEIRYVVPLERQLIVLVIWIVAVLILGVAVGVLADWEAACIMHLLSKREARATNDRKERA